MKLFICWSSDRGYTLAKALTGWLPKVIEGLEHPFLSSEIEAGTRWSDTVEAALRESDAGLVCLTPEGVDSSWIHYEAGALALAVKGVLYTYSHNVPAERMPDPLKRFQATSTTRDRTLHLVRSIASERSEAPGDEANLGERFNRAWPELEGVIAGLRAVTIEVVVPDFRELFTGKTFIEPMPDCTDYNWIGRLERLARVDAVLKRLRPRVVALEELHLRWLYDRLIETIDRYAMHIRSVVLLAKDGKPIPTSEIPQPFRDGCEGARISIFRLTQQLLDPTSAPVLIDAARFQGLDTAQRKEATQALERRIADGDKPIAAADRSRAINSFWDLDRIVSYQLLEVESALPEQVRDVAQQLRRELERVQTRTIPGSLMPLYCSTRALAVALEGLHASPGTPRDVRAILEIADDLEKYVSADAKRDGTGGFARRIASIRASLAAAVA